MSRLAEGVANGLLEGGVRAVFGVPGSGTSYSILTKLLADGIPFYSTSHEAAGAIMAGAFGRQSGTVGCSISIKGPGLANMLPGIASNHFERWPAISIAEAVGPATPPGRVHKRLDQRTLLSSLVKAYATSGESSRMISRLLSCAGEEVPGPVHLDLPAGGPESFATLDAAKGPTSPAQGSWTDVRKHIAQSARPVLVVGALARRRPWRERLANLRVPVFTTLAAKGVLKEHLPQSAGVFTGDGKALSPEYGLLRETDLVIGLGLRNFEILNPAAVSSELALIDVVSPDVATGFAPTVLWTSATDEQCEELLADLEEREWGRDAIASAVEAVREKLLQNEWLPAAVFASLEEALPDAVLVVDTGAFCTIAEHIWRTSDPNGFLASANGRYMGTSVPMAIGAALAQPGRPVICATGDGGVRMYFAEIKLACEHKLPILFLLLSDGRYGSIAAAMSPERRQAKLLAMPNPSWFASAQGLGCPAEVVEDIGGLLAAVERWRTRGGPHFIEAPFDPEAYVTMTYDLRQ